VKEVVFVLTFISDVGTGKTTAATSLSLSELGYCGMCTKPRGDTKERAPGTPDD
jgi:hypothetical protein